MNPEKASYEKKHPVGPISGVNSIVYDTLK